MAFGTNGAAVFMRCRMGGSRNQRRMLPIMSMRGFRVVLPGRPFSSTDQMPEQYRRYLINSLRERFDLPGVPIRISVRSGKNPYAEGESKGGAASIRNCGSASRRRVTCPAVPAGNPPRAFTVSAKSPDKTYR